jgi:hypothetical protein
MQVFCLRLLLAATIIGQAMVSSFSFNTLQKESNRLGHTFFDGLQTPYVVLYHIYNDEQIQKVSFDALSLCYSPEFGLFIDMKAMPTNPTYDEVKDSSQNDEYFKIRPYRTSNSKHYSSAWSRTCMVSRWLIQEGADRERTPHFELVRNNFSII